MININPRSDVSIFEQIVLEIGRYIAMDVLKPNEKLPSVRVLAKELGINPNTVAKAYLECEARGLTYSQPGIGHFISEKHENLDILKAPIYMELKRNVTSLIQLGDTFDLIIQNLKEASYDNLS